MQDNIGITILNQISHVIVHQKNIPFLLQEVIDILDKDFNVKRSTLTLKKRKFVFIEASHGLSKKEKKLGKYRIGEGVTGSVAKTGKSIIIPDISKESKFLNRTGSFNANDKIAFICVPIINNKEILGTLSVDRNITNKHNLKQDQFLLETVANILADVVANIREEIHETEKLLAENERLKSELDQQLNPKNIIGNCRAMKSVYAMITQVADSLATVLIRGESGTGKELVARAIHYASLRKNKKFIAVNCAALPENLIESELFGHEKGSFTGATSLRKGRAELADGGTLFLDEIGDISLGVQVKLLRFLQEKTFERVGGSTLISTDVRILAATSKNLEIDMNNGGFREDLFYRLNVFPIYMPALRERKSDITLLADFFLSKYNKLYEKNIKRLSTPTINMMMSYHWPGNVRELENCIERAVLMSNDDVIHGYNLPPSLQINESSNNPYDNVANFATLVSLYEKELIVDTLKETQGNATTAANKLQLTKRIINYKIHKYNINTKQYK